MGTDEIIIMEGDRRHGRLTDIYGWSESGQAILDARSESDRGKEFMRSNLTPEERAQKWEVEEFVRDREVRR
jgi:hypothetical protein